MASMKLEKQLEEQPPGKKPRIDNGQEGKNASNPNESELPKSAEGVEESTNFTPSAGRHRKLPVELERQIFLCFNPATQRKFIWGLGWNFYAMFRHKLLIKTKRFCNPHGNHWNRTNTRATVAADGLSVSNNTVLRPIVYAEQPFLISGPQCRMDDFPGTICYYYEVQGNMWTVGLSDGAIPDISLIREYSNSYAIPNYINFHDCWLAGERHQFELPEGAIRPRWKYNSINVFGCGVVLDPADKLSIFSRLMANSLEFNVHKYVLMVHSDVFMKMFSHKNTKEDCEGRIVIEDSTAKAVCQMLIYMYTGKVACGFKFKVHKYVLMLNSDVFMAMFSHENTIEAREGRIVIEDSTGTAVCQMLIYMYTSELTTEYAIETDVGPLLHIANKYLIKPLVQLIEQELVNSLSLKNVIDRLEMADLYQNKLLYSACGRLIRRKLKIVKKDAKWLELKKKLPELAFAILEEIVEENSIHVCNICDLSGHFARTCPNCHREVSN